MWLFDFRGFITDSYGVTSARALKGVQNVATVLQPFFTALENWLVEKGVFGFLAIQTVTKKEERKLKGLNVSCARFLSSKKV